MTVNGHPKPPTARFQPQKTNYFPWFLESLAWPECPERTHSGPSPETRRRGQGDVCAHSLCASPDTGREQTDGAGLSRTRSPRKRNGTTARGLLSAASRREEEPRSPRNELLSLGTELLLCPRPSTISGSLPHFGKCYISPLNVPPAVGLPQLPLEAAMWALPGSHGDRSRGQSPF